MNEYKYHYLCTSFDIDAFDLDDFKFNSVNITAFRLVDIEDISVRDTINDIQRFHHNHEQQKNQSIDAKACKTLKFIGVSGKERFFLFLSNYLINFLFKIKMRKP